MKKETASMIKEMAIVLPCMVSEEFEEVKLPDGTTMYNGVKLTNIVNDTVFYIVEDVEGDMYVEKVNGDLSKHSYIPNSICDTVVKKVVILAEIIYANKTSICMV